jgi:iron complex outermembrane receptor protein
LWRDFNGQGDGWQSNRLTAAAPVAEQLASAIHRGWNPGLLGIGAAAMLCGVAAAQERRPSPFDLSIEELGELQVTSVSRRAENLSDAAASIYVITAEDIRRSGVTSLPEALRLAPGIEVARNSAHEYTISIRGFSSDLSNKLLVLIDGRSVYSPLFAGVFWDVQDTLLEDIERIEIVSGPGGAVWGANAVNGVINVITHSANDTPGTLIKAGAGDEETSAAVRHGWAISEKMDARAYVKHFERDSSELVSGADAFDEWNMSRAGFGLQWRPGAADRVTVDTEAYVGEQQALLRGNFTLGTLPQTDIPGQVDVSGHHVLARWRRDLTSDANWRLQFYYDHTDRQIPGAFNEARDTLDVDFQHDMQNRGRHDVLWGAGLRSTRDDIGTTLFATFEPDSRSDQTLHAFIQDRIELRPNRLFLTAGSKVEDNDYSGFEFQPSVQVSWLPSDRQAVWASVSRAVRIPARLNADLRLTVPVAIPGVPLPLYVMVNGNDDFDSEDLSAYEAGYRMQIRSHLSLDVAVFDNRYDNLQTQEAQAPFVVPGPPTYLVLAASLDNLMEGESYGGTIVVNWEPIASWRLQFQYAHTELDLTSKPGSNDAGALTVAGNSPGNQVSVLSFLELPHDLSLFTGIRYVEELPSQSVPSYTAIDWSLAWRPTDNVRASLTVQNANERRHIEFGEGRQLERSALLTLVWKF